MILMNFDFIQVIIMNNGYSNVKVIVLPVNKQKIHDLLIELNWFHGICCNS